MTNPKKPPATLTQTYLRAQERSRRVKQTEAAHKQVKALVLGWKPKAL